MVRVWPLVLLCACGRLDFDPRMPDSGTVLGSGPFGNVHAIAELASTFEDDDPAISADGLELFWASKRTGLSKIWTSRRASRDDPWGTPQQVVELDLSTDDKGPHLARDGVTLYFEVTTGIALATRATPTSMWSTPVIALDPGFTVGTPAVCAANTQLYVRIGSSSMQQDIGLSTRAAATDPWPAPVVIAEVSSAVIDSGPWLSEDCNRMYLDSTRANSGSIFITERDAQSGLFATPVELTELRAAVGAVHDVSLASDERDLVFSHNTGGINQLYEASR